MIDKELLDILACPKRKGDLKSKEEHLICLNCKKYCLIRDRIPILLIDETRDLEEDFERN